MWRATSGIRAAQSLIHSAGLFWHRCAVTQRGNKKQIKIFRLISCMSESLINGRTLHCCLNTCCSSRVISAHYYASKPKVSEFPLFTKWPLQRQLVRVAYFSSQKSTRCVRIRWKICWLHYFQNDQMVNCMLTDSLHKQHSTWPSVIHNLRQCLHLTKAFVRTCREPYIDPPWRSPSGCDLYAGTLALRPPQTGTQNHCSWCGNKSSWLAECFGREAVKQQSSGATNTWPKHPITSS